MSDNKVQGSSRVPDETVAAFVQKTTLEASGVYGMGTKKSRGVRIVYDEESGYIIDVYLVVGFGTNIPETAWNVQKNAYEGLKNEFGIEPESINIHVQGVYAKM